MKTYSIGIVGLSLPVEKPAVTEATIEYLRNMGHTVTVGNTVFQKVGYKTASIQERVEDVERFFMDDNIDMILNVHGGYNSNEMLEFLNYNTIAKHPKPFIGYSDITAVNLALYHKANIPTSNGPMLGTYASDPNCFNRFFAQLESKEFTYQNTPLTYSGRTNEHVVTGPVKTLSSKKDTAQGTAIAGNMSTFCLLLGTPYMPTLDNAVLFLEYDIVELRGLPSMERFLWQIRHSGIFDKISALVIGRLEPKVEAEETLYGYSVEEMLTFVTEGFTFPVLYHTQFGHIHPSWWVENGAPCHINKTAITIKKE